MKALVGVSQFRIKVSVNDMGHVVRVQLWPHDVPAQQDGTRP